MSQIFAKKPVSMITKDAAHSGGLRRVLGPWGLTSLGIGAIIGAGIFVLTGEVAAQYTGPAIILSFIFAGIGCGFCGLCYAEMSSMFPVAGSVYSYAYLSLGELIAWLVGWDLILEYSLGAATVAVGWSGYLISFLKDFGISFPPALSAANGTELVFFNGGWSRLSEALLTTLHTQGIDPTALPHVTAVFNLPAAMLVLAVTILLIVGIQESVRVNNIIVVIKLIVLALFIGVGTWYIMGHPALWQENWKEFLPANKGSFGDFGWSGVLRGAGAIFFAYIGFDAVSVAAQEAINPQKDVPVGILASLGICTILYIVVSIILTVVVHYSTLLVPDPVAVGINAMHEPWLSPIVKFGAIAGLSSVSLTLLLAQPRIFWSMACDGLLPPVFTKLHPKFKTPYITTAVTGVLVAIVAGTVSLQVLGTLVSLGTLLAFGLVCLTVNVMRKQFPDLHRPFRVPGVPLVPILGALICFSQMVSLPAVTWKLFGSWLLIGVAVYWFYGRTHSKVQNGKTA